MTRKVCIVTGTRAEYGLLRYLMKEIQINPELELQIIATGMHLSPEFGLTWQAIEFDGFNINRKVEMLLSSDTPVGISKSIALGVSGMADAFVDLEPDILVLLGDRFEILAAAISAMTACIPIVHLHGGEATEGLIDEAIRHSITKMSHFHFVASEVYRNRVIQLGEDPDRVFTVGGLGLDALSNLNLLQRPELERTIDFSFKKKNLLITYHPVTLERHQSANGFSQLLSALEQLTDTGLIFTYPNADTEGRELIRMIDDFVSSHSNARAYSSLGQLLYLSCMHHVDGVIGNSSSGLIEAPALKKATVNIGSRQDGRIRAKSVIDCPPDRSCISDAIRLLYSDQFQQMLPTITNPYGVPGASSKIASMISDLHLDGVLHKRFYDLGSHAHTLDR